MPQNQSFSEFFSQYFLIDLNDISNFFDFSNWVFIINIIKSIALILIVLLICGIIYLIIRLNVIGEKIKPIKKTFLKSQNVSKENSKAFQRIKEMAKHNSLDEDRLALLEASLLFSKALRSLGYEGNLVEIIPKVTLWKTVTPSEILSANDLKTKIVHLQNRDFSHFEVEKALEIYEKALKDLKAI